MKRPTIRSSHGNEYAVLGELRDGALLCLWLHALDFVGGPSISVWRLRDSDAPCEILTYGDVDYEKVTFVTNAERAGS